MAAIAESFLTSCGSGAVVSICKLIRSGRLLPAMDVSGPIVANVLILIHLVDQYQLLIKLQEVRLRQF